MPSNRSNTTPPPPTRPAPPPPTLDEQLGSTKRRPQGALYRPSYEYVCEQKDDIPLTLQALTRDMLEVIARDIGVPYTPTTSRPALCANISDTLATGDLYTELEVARSACAQELDRLAVFIQGFPPERRAAANAQLEQLLQWYDDSVALIDSTNTVAGLSQLGGRFRTMCSRTVQAIKEELRTANKNVDTVSIRKKKPNSAPGSLRRYFKRRRGSSSFSKTPDIVRQ